MPSPKKSRKWKKSRVAYGDVCQMPGCKLMAVDTLKVDGKFRKLCRMHFIGPELPSELVLVRSNQDVWM